MSSRYRVVGFWTIATTAPTGPNPGPRYVLHPYPRATARSPAQRPRAGWASDRTGADVAVGVVIRARAGQLLQETPVDERDGRERPQGAVSVEHIDRATDRRVLGPPQPQERHVAVVVPARHPLGGQPVPDRRQLRDVEAVFNPVGLARVLVDAIGEGRAQDGAEVLVEGRPVGNRAAEEGEAL